MKKEYDFFANGVLQRRFKTWQSARRRALKIMSLHPTAKLDIIERWGESWNAPTMLFWSNYQDHSIQS